MSKGLFHRAISMSGTSISPWAFIEEPEVQAKEYAADLNCPTENTTIMVQCLKSLDAQAIARIHFRYIVRLWCWMWSICQRVPLTSEYFTPVVQPS